MGLELEPATLAEFINECVEAEAVRRQRDDDRRTADIEVLFNQAIAAAKAKLTFVPPQLRQFVVFAGRRPDDSTLRAGWVPLQFNVRAPGLAEIIFTVGVGGALLTLKTLSVGGKPCDSWTQAVARAHEQRAREVKQDGTSTGI